MSANLDGDILVAVVTCIKNFVFCLDPAIAYDYLYYLSKTDRFDMNLSFLEDSEVELISNFIKQMNKPCIADQLEGGQDSLNALLDIYGVE